VRKIEVEPIFILDKKHYTFEKKERFLNKMTHKFLINNSLQNIHIAKKTIQINNNRHKINIKKQYLYLENRIF